MTSVFPLELPHVDAGLLSAAVVAGADDAIVAVTLDGVVQVWNTAAEGLFGLAAPEMIGRAWSAPLAGAGPQPLGQVLARVGRGETVRDVRVDWGAETAPTVAVTVSPIMGPERSVIGASLIARPAPAAVEEPARPDPCHSGGPVGWLTLDEDFRYLAVNAAAAALSATSAAEHAGRTMADLAPQLWAQLQPACRAVLDGDAPLVDLDITTPAPRRAVRAWLASVYPLHHHGPRAGVGVVLVDISARKQAERALEELTHAVVDTIAATIEAKDPYHSGHERRVADIAAAIATHIGLDEWATEGIKLAAKLRDIGKINTPTEILYTPGDLGPLQLLLVQGHSQAGYDIISDIVFPWPIAHMILQHHERLDGSGYPDGLRGDDIIIGARIIAVADVINSMTSDRPHRRALPLPTALEELQNGRGTIYDADIVDACQQLCTNGTLTQHPDTGITIHTPHP